MSATLFYRIAAFVFFVGCIGHTHHILSPQYGRVSRGLGLMGTASMLFWAFLSWHLGELARSAPGAIGALGWAFFAVQLGGVVLSLLYFGLPARVLSVLFAVIVGLSAALAQR
jgi:hypothetical protein